MTVFKSAKFEAEYKKLQPDIKRKVDASLAKWAEDPSHPTLEWKVVNREERWWSIRISNTGFRAVCIEIPDDDDPTDIDYRWFAVKCHDDYIRLLP